MARSSLLVRHKSCGTEQERKPSRTSGTIPSHTCPSGNEPNIRVVRSELCIWHTPSADTASRIWVEHKRGGKPPGRTGHRIANDKRGGNFSSPWVSYPYRLQFQLPPELRSRPALDLPTPPDRPLQGPRRPTARRGGEGVSLLPSSSTLC